MPFTDEEKPAGKAGSGLAPAPRQDHARSLDEISRLLHRMLTLAEMSASDMAVDRELLQKVFDRLRNEVDRIADTL